MNKCARGASWFAVWCLLAWGARPSLAQATAPDAPSAQQAPQTAAPAPAGELQPMPPPDPANFTAPTPTKETVSDFLKASWGYDPNRIWQVQAIQTTPVQGLSKVTVLVQEKGSQQQQPSALVFLTLPDGKHLIANDDVLPFGPRPFDGNNSTLERETNGPSRGPQKSSLLLVEFADFECPHCKEAQPLVDRLLKEYPEARYVAQPFPLRNIHSEAEKAAEAGVCVAKIGGNEAYFKYSDAVYANQASLTPQGSSQAIQAAIAASGADPAKVQSCVSQPTTKAAIDESLRLGNQLGVNSTPTLFVNGRNLPFGGIPFETLKQIIDYDLKQVGAAK
jgi:protein-disulfide isomerase